MQLPFKLTFKRSLKSTILWLFIPIIVVCIPLTGTISYMLASEQLKSNANTSIYDTVSQTKYFLDDRLTAILSDLTALDNDSEVQAILNRVSQPNYTMKPKEYVVLYNKLNKVYSDFFTVIDSILLYYEDGKIAMYKKDYLTSDVRFSRANYFNPNGDVHSQVFWLNLHSNELEPSNDSDDQVVSLYKWINKGSSSKNGIILINLKESFFQSILNAPIISRNGTMILASKDGIMGFKTAEDPYGLDKTTIQEALMRTDKASGELEFNNEHHKEMIMLYDTLGINKWKIAAVFPKDELYSKVNYIQYVSYSVMLGVLAIAIFLSGVLANIITKPLTNLTKKVNSIEQGNLDVKLSHRSTNEIGVLNKGIADMLARIKRLLEQVEHEQEKKRISELAALQAQIHPHFLYNTLYSIKQLCDMGETEDAGKMVTALSNFFRTSISKGKEIIPISNEIEHIQTYLSIQKMRYGDDFTYEIHIPPEMMNDHIVKLTLQPIVENAIYHGVKKTRKQGTIRIVGGLNGNEALFLVEDNGPGMSGEQLSNIQAGLQDSTESNKNAGFGLRNVHRRLQLHYGLDYGINIFSTEGTGTTVMVRIRARNE